MSDRSLRFEEIIDYSLKNKDDYRDPDDLTPEEAIALEGKSIKEMMDFFKEKDEKIRLRKLAESKS